MQYWLPGSPESMFAFTTEHVVIEFPERTSDCPEPKFKKNSTKNRDIAIPMTKWSLRDWPCIKDLALIWWISARFFDAGEICELRLHTVTCLALPYVGKQHRTNNEPQNRIIWPWIEHRFHRKSNYRPKFAKVQFISIFIPIFLRFNNYIEFLIQCL